MHAVSEAYVTSYDSAPEFWFADTSARILAERSKTNGAMSLVKLSIPYGHATPVHVHTTQDEAFFILFGAIKGICGVSEFEAEAGSFVFLPRGVKHAFQGVSEIPAEALVISVPGGFDDYVAEAGYPVTEGTDTSTFTVDVAALVEIGSRHDIDIVGPPVNFL